MSHPNVPTGFVFPFSPGEFGVTFKEFQILGVTGEFVIPGSKSKPLGPNAFPGAVIGPCKVEVYGDKSTPYNLNPKDVLFKSRRVEFGFGRSSSSPEPFAVIRSKHAKEIASDLQTFVGQPINLVFRPEPEEQTLRADPNNKGWTLGWGVHRNSPWHFAGLFPDEATARKKAEELGPDYRFGYGSNQDGSDNFITTS
jgi:hypothetical protein